MGKLRGDGLGARARRGSFFVVLQFGTSNALRLISNLALTRLLFPEAFGLMALVQVVMAGLTMMSDLGLKAAIVQHERGEELPFLRTAWTLQVIRAQLLAVLVALSGPWVAEFYNEPLLAVLIPVAAIGMALEGFMPVRIMLVERQIKLGRYTMLNIAAQIISLIVTLVLAWVLQSVWALVLGNILNAVLRNILYRVALPGPRDGFQLERAATRDLITFGAFVFISSLAAYAIIMGDRAILGKFISIEMLGIYAVAVTMGTVPMLLGNALIGQIIFPLYSRRPPQESDENRRMLFRARHLLTALIVAGTAIFVLIGDPMMRFLYDARYHLAGPMTVLVAMGVLPSLVTASYGSILLSNGRSDLNAVLTVVGAVLRVGAIYLGVVHYGVAGAALAPIVATILQYPLLVALIRPYRGWDLVHDLIYGALVGVVIWVGWYINSDAILTLLDVAGGSS